jgi:signal transduction histidine kinase
MTRPAPVNVEPRQSIAWRLPLLVAALLITVVGTLCIAAYREVRQALVTTSAQHATDVAQQLVSLLDQATQAGIDRAAALAKMPAVAASLQNPHAGDTLLGRVMRPNQNLLGIGIRRSGPEWLVWLDGPAAQRLDAQPSDAASGTPSVAASEQSHLIRAPQDIGAAGIGPLRQAGATIYYDVVAPIPAAAGSESEGWLVMRFSLNSSEANHRLAALVGDSARFLTGSSSTGVWSDLGTAQAAPVELGNGRFDWNNGAYQGAVVGSTVTPWQTWVGLPEATVMSPAVGLIRRMSVIAGLILLLGTVLAVVLARHIARPIVHLTKAAEEISQGHYEAQVPVERQDEIGRLAVAFNRMSGRISEATHNLEDQVSGRTRELKSALQELHDAQEQLVRREKLAMLGQLASGVGHELRNPLGVMTNAIYYLDMVQPDAPGNVKEYLGIMRSQLTLAEKIVADLLDFSRLKKPDRQHVTLESVIEHQITRVTEARGITFARDFQEPTPVFVDPVQVGQIVFNLLTNAVQATGDEGGTITVRTRHDDGRSWLEVEDRGVGIEASHLNKVFEPLFTTKARGIGLGLSVSKSLAENNEGSLDVRSRQGHGATFTLTFPTERSA